MPKRTALEQIELMRTLFRDGGTLARSTDWSGSGTLMVAVATVLCVGLGAWTLLCRRRTKASATVEKDAAAKAGAFFEVIGFGIIGASAASNSVVVRPSSSLLIDVRGVADPKPAAAAAFAKAHGLRQAYASCQALLDDRSVHAVFVATSLESRARWVAHALRCGKHVLYEAPLQLPSSATAAALPRIPHAVCMRASHALHHPLVERLAARVAALHSITTVDVDVALPWAPPQRFLAVARNALLPHIGAVALDIVGAVLGMDHAALAASDVRAASRVAERELACSVALRGSAAALTLRVRVGAGCGLPRARVTVSGTGRRGEPSGVVCDNFLLPHLWHRVFPQHAGWCAGRSETAYAADGRRGADFLLRDFCSAIYCEREMRREGGSAARTSGHGERSAAFGGDASGAEALLRTAWRVAAGSATSGGSGSGVGSNGASSGGRDAKPPRKKRDAGKAATAASKKSSRK
jgi:predicted dehydrogenase